LVSQYSDPVARDQLAGSFARQCGHKQNPRKISALGFLLTGATMVQVALSTCCCSSDMKGAFHRPWEFPGQISGELGMTTDRSDPLPAEIASSRSLIPPNGPPEQQRRPATSTTKGQLDQLLFQAQLLESVQESVIATDLDGNVSYWGHGAEELYGYAAEEVIGKCITFIVDPRDEHGELDRLSQVVETGFWKGEYQQRRKDGSTFWASTTISLVTDAQGNPAGFIGIDLDITDLKRSNEEINQLRLAIENAMQGISRLDREGRFMMVKPQYAQMLGYEPEELLGKSWAVTVPDDDYAIASEGYQTMLQHGRAELECRARRKDGSVFFKQLLLVKTFDEHDERNGHFCFMRDITKRKQAEGKLKEKEAQLAHVSRLSTMGELVAGIAHEINQPLYAIANFATVAKKKLETMDTPEGHSLAELNRKIGEQAVRAGDIIRRLRTFVGKSDGVRSTFDVNDVVREAASILAPIKLRAHAVINVQLVDEPALIHADHVQLEQVVVNLIRNALEAVEHSEKREITIKTSLPDRMVEISVADSGKGIPQSDIAMLFDAFFTTKDSGLGMGLAISRTIIESHNGRIWVEQQSASGAVFHVALPRC
jgi:two-component system sensor kinase FixL